MEAAIGTSYVGYRPTLMDRLLPIIDVLEVTPDILRVDAADAGRLDRNALSELRDCSREVPIAVHGIGLSIATADGWSTDYLRSLDAFIGAVPTCWHSEHLGFTTVVGRFMGTMIPALHTDEALDLVRSRCDKLGAWYGIPFLLENVAPLLPAPQQELRPAQFLNALCGDGACGVLLDLYNLECAAQNNGLHIPSFLDELDHRQVKEIHVACGVERDGILTDVHSRCTRDTTLDCLKSVLSGRYDRVQAVIFEFLPEALPALGVERVIAELKRIRAALE